MKDDDLGPILRKAYAEAPETATPSPLLWERTRRALRAQRARSRAAWIGTMATAAAAALVIAFLGGVSWERHLADRASRGPAAASPAEAAEQVQFTGSAYAKALDALVQSLNTASAAQLVTSQNVVLALSRAQAGPIRVLLANRPDSLRFETTPVIWF